jgi:hypothetical protein
MLHLIRRWLRFSLWTMFVVITMAALVLGLALSHSKNWIRQRHNFLNHQMVVALEHDYTQEGTPYWEPVSAPGLLWLFGEKGQYSIRLVVVNEVTLAKEYHEAQRLFPEAMIMLIAPQYWPNELPTSLRHGWRITPGDKVSSGVVSSERDTISKALETRYQRTPFYRSTVDLETGLPSTATHGQ